MQLKARTCRWEESLVELAEDVERLVRLAYPEGDKAMVEVVPQDQFIDALPEEDFRFRIRQNKPATLANGIEAGVIPTCQQAEGPMGCLEQNLVQ